MAAKNEALLEQADTLWKMLDDLAETNPEGYKKLIDNVMKEQREHWKAPEPVFCFRTAKLPESSNRYVFVNICKWETLSKAKSDTQLSVMASELRDLPDSNSKHSVVDLCFHSDILDQKKKGAQCLKVIASLALDYLEKQIGIKLLKAYKILAIKYKGDIEELKRFLFSRTFAGRPSSKPVGQPSSQTEGNSVLDGLSRIAQNKNAPSPSGIPKDFKGLPSDTLVGKREEKTPKKPLIQEVSTSKITKAKQKDTVPKYNMEIVMATSEKPKHILVKVELPSIQSGAECELDVSKQDLVLLSEKCSELHLHLPEEGNEDATTSTFNKTTHELTIIIPTAKK